MQKFWVRSKRLHHLQNIKQHGHVCLHQTLLLSKSHSGDLGEALKGACVVTGYVIGEEQWGTPYFYSKQQANLFVVPEGDMSSSLKVFLLHTQPSWEMAWGKCSLAFLTHPLRAGWDTLWAYLFLLGFCQLFLGVLSPSWITALSWRRGLRNSNEALPFRATQDGWVTMKSSDKMWSTGRGSNNPLQ